MAAMKNESQLPPFLVALFKLPLWALGLIGAVIAGIVLMFVMDKPAKGGPPYAICKIVLEQTVRFPDRLRIMLGVETENGAVIGYTEHNPFGSEQTKVMECTYGFTKKGRPIIKKVMIDRQPISQDLVDSINAVLPALLMSKFNVDLPMDLPANLEDVKK